jgi:hypothetical protein
MPDQVSRAEPTSRGRAGRVACHARSALLGTSPKAAKGDLERFTGEVLLERLGEAGVNLLRVTFRAGARRATNVAKAGDLDLRSN